ncbi:MAG: hypothetical protein O9267_03685 [Flavobacterium sp.]|uniref:hypothetical protein n=1 Tax=Flavobacterium sp. TaxID=239 RepID=UPI0022C0E4F9|nr:hypothetical protein [Flavobacterium sp.]MCZ8196693.1 hypothetical protein [Flavobacterium sp.]
MKKYFKRLKTYNRTNFHKHTFCIFKEVDFNEIQELKCNYQSKSGSSYYFTEDGVYRYSNHWGRAANCKWRLDSNPKLQATNSNRTRLGFAKWTGFYPENDFEKLYFIEVDYQNKTANFYHKQSENFNKDKVVRTSVETTKLLKQIRTLLEETAWAKHLNVENIESARKEIIEQLITTNQSFQEIRRNYL